MNVHTGVLVRNRKQPHYRLKRIRGIFSACRKRLFHKLCRFSKLEIHTQRRFQTGPTESPVSPVSSESVLWKRMETSKPRTGAPPALVPPAAGVTTTRPARKPIIAASSTAPWRRKAKRTGYLLHLLCILLMYKISLFKSPSMESLALRTGAAVHVLYPAVCRKYRCFHGPAP